MRLFVFLFGNKKNKVFLDLIFIKTFLLKGNFLKKINTHHFFPLSLARGFLRWEKETLLYLFEILLIFFFESFQSLITLCLAPLIAILDILKKKEIKKEIKRKRD